MECKKQIFSNHLYCTQLNSSITYNERHIASSLHLSLSLSLPASLSLFLLTWKGLPPFSFIESRGAEKAFSSLRANQWRNVQQKLPTREALILQHPPLHKPPPQSPLQAHEIFPWIKIITSHHHLWHTLLWFISDFIKLYEQGSE